MNTRASVKPFDVTDKDDPLGWPIYNRSSVVVKRLHLEPGVRRLALLVATGACGKIGIKRSALTSPLQSRKAVDARNLFAFFMRFHPYSRLVFEQLGKMLDRDHTTVHSGLVGGRGFLWRLKGQPQGPEGDAVRLINANLALFRPEFGGMDLDPYLYGQSGIDWKADRLKARDNRAGMSA